VSSGLGGVYPRGIPIGTIISEMKTAEGFAKSYLMRPVVSLPDISSVFILTRERVRAGVDNVWNNGVYADSLRKAMVAAGDSLHLRRDTVVKAPAKRDSAAKVPLKRDSIVKAPAKRDTTVKPPRKSP
jgi:rod shape-determining protein MreC